MSENRILIVVKEAEARKAYEAELTRVGAAYDVAGSFQEVVQLSIEKAYSGLLIDLLTLVRSSKEDKQIAYDCLNFYPSLRVKYDTRQKSINLSPLEQAFSADASTTLTYFIEQRCASFQARSLRRHQRKESCLCVRLSHDPGFPEPGTLRTFTVNVSEGGAFLHCVEGFAKGDTVWLSFHDLPELEPIRARVRWSVEWGYSHNIPGIGVMFLEPTRDQLEAVARLARF